MTEGDRAEVGSLVRNLSQKRDDAFHAARSAAPRARQGGASR